MAQSLTGWTQAEAAGLPLETVFRIVHEVSPNGVENRTAWTLPDGIAVGVAHSTLLTARDGTERSIDVSATSMRNVPVEGAAVLIVFRDITEHRRQERAVRDALEYAGEIIATLREPFVVLDKDPESQQGERLLLSDLSRLER